MISSLRSFDREQQKEYLIPIVIKDAGNPAMSGTSTLTVIIGDVNDNKMQPGSKEILVYNYLSKNLDYSVSVCTRAFNICISFSVPIIVLCNLLSSL